MSPIDLLCCIYNCLQIVSRCLKKPLVNRSLTSVSAGILPTKAAVISRAPRAGIFFWLVQMIVFLPRVLKENLIGTFVFINSTTSLLWGGKVFPPKVRGVFFFPLWSLNKIKLKKKSFAELIHHQIIWNTVCKLKLLMRVCPVVLLRFMIKCVFRVEKKAKWKEENLKPCCCCWEKKNPVSFAH